MAVAIPSPTAPFCHFETETGRHLSMDVSFEWRANRHARHRPRRPDCEREARWRLAPGRHVTRAVTARGASDEVRIEVR